MIVNSKETLRRAVLYKRQKNQSWYEITNNPEAKKQSLKFWIGDFEKK